MGKANDEWQAEVTREAARAIGRWLEGRGRLDRPIATLSQFDLECMATNAISRFIVLTTQRINSQPEGNDDLIRLLRH